MLVNIDRTEGDVAGAVTRFSVDVKGELIPTATLNREIIQHKRLLVVAKTLI